MSRKGSKKSRSSRKNEEETDVNMDNEMRNENDQNSVEDNVSDNENTNNNNENNQDNNDDNDNENDNDNEDNDENEDENDDDDGDENGNDNDNDDGNGNVRRGRGRPSGSGTNKGTRARGRGGLRTKARDNRYRVYIFKVLQQVHPKVTITKTAMDIVNSFIEDMFDKICNEAMKLCHTHKTHTIGAREISTAAKLILPGELRKHAILEGDKALKIFLQNQKDMKKRRELLRGNKKGEFRGKTKK